MSVLTFSHVALTHESLEDCQVVKNYLLTRQYLKFDSLPRVPHRKENYYLFVRFNFPTFPLTNITLGNCQITKN